MKWTDKLFEENPAVYSRLCACHNTREDIPVLVNSRWNWMKSNGQDKEGYTKEDALADIIDWLDSNSQWFDLTRAEYDDIIKE